MYLLNFLQFIYRVSMDNIDCAENIEAATVAVVTGVAGAVVRSSRGGGKLAQLLQKPGIPQWLAIIIAFLLLSLHIYSLTLRGKVPETVATDKNLE